MKRPTYDLVRMTTDQKTNIQKWKCAFPSQIQQSPLGPQRQTGSKWIGVALFLKGSSEAKPGYAGKKKIYGHRRVAGRIKGNGETSQSTSAQK